MVYGNHFGTCSFVPGMCHENVHFPFVETQAYVLNFHGRVTQASVKNFQLIHDSDRKPGFNDGTQLCSMVTAEMQHNYTCMYFLVICLLPMTSVTLNLHKALTLMPLVIDMHLFR